MNALLADAATTRLILEYVLYAAIIVVGIAVLLLLRRKSRLPRHTELKKSLTQLLSEMQAFYKEELPRLRTVKALSKLIYRIDKLTYVTDRMAEKERDGEIANISSLLSQARTELAADRYGARTEQGAGASACNKIAQACELIGRVIDRDTQIRAEVAKK